MLALPALVVWVATAHTTVGWGDALGIASAGWFLGHGASVAVGELSLSLAPLGLWLLALLLTVRGARRLLDRTERSAPGTTWPRTLARQVVPGFLLGYAATAFLAWLLTLAGPARPGIAGVLVVLGVPVLALAWALLSRYVAGEECGVVGDWLDRLPRWLPRAVRPGVHGAGVLLGLGHGPRRRHGREPLGDRLGPARRRQRRRGRRGRAHRRPAPRSCPTSPSGGSRGSPDPGSRSPTGRPSPWPAPTPA